MARENEKTVQKFYDKDVVNGWALKYEYESENGLVPRELKATATKENANATITAGGGNTFVNWNGASADKVVLVAVFDEFDIIAAQFTTQE